MPDYGRSGPSGGSEPREAGSVGAIPSSVGAIFPWPVRIYWEDTDAGGIVFYANYLKFFERARTEWLRSLGLSQQALKSSTGCIFVVTDTTLRYVRPARLDDALIVTAALQESGRASLIMKQQALLKSEQSGPACTTLLCEGTVRIGWVDAASMQPKRLPAHLRQRLTS